ncbi:MAG: protein kinase [Myxococcales bacterium]|nr:protein kinase [Myxococcales bacterium]
MTLSPTLPLIEVDPRRELGASFGAPEGPEEELGLDDAGLLTEYLGGNPAAYGELVRRHQIAIFRLLLGLLADEDLAEEACEEVFVVAERRLPDLTDRTGFYHWILGIAREVSAAYNERGAFDETVASFASSPRDRLKFEIHAVLQVLAPDLRLVLVLSELRGAPDEDVAAALGCPKGDVPGLLDEARAEFARILDARSTATVPGSASPRGSMLPARLEIGAVIDDTYRIVAPLDEGGMGAVYRASPLDGGAEVALKTLLPALLNDDQALRRFAREIEAIQRIGHENFVKVLGHGRSGEIPYLVMELLKGSSLSDLQHRGPIAPRRAVRLTCEILRGLAHAHDVGVIHRDLKPANVFVLDPGGPAERVRILDLGLAKLTTAEDDDAARTRLTEEGMVFGTPTYMAPEQALGEEVDARADLYAVAVILFLLLTGRHPFESPNASALLVMHVSSPPPILDDLAPQFAGTGLAEVLVRGLAKKREDRFGSAAELIAALDACVARGLPGPDEALDPTLRSLPSPPPPASARAPQASAVEVAAAAPSRRGRWVALVVALVVAVGVAALVLWGR